MKIIPFLAALFLLVVPVPAMSFGPQAEPELPLEKALELAKAYAREQKMDLSGHYLDRVWAGWQEGQEGRRWIVSWSPKPEQRKPGGGWIIVTVKFDGTVEQRKGRVPWLYREPSERVLPPK
ncbi:hypothetical protein OKA05_29055 [Luteolibacter arcticus]|uniref:NTF2 fold domain-containing protein n=1 Tax=Luteolibacter arcticus TaxID=1581411 RepID=A0ABT3GSX6_9BACT|nr:hypothetical protein [Luteolibacter arcticus]MCW1926637.1 hypothetical protein [Luteolibacter arcticus]